MTAVSYHFYAPRLLRDLAEMAGVDKRTQGLHSVTSREVVWGKPGRTVVTCVDHGAMNCVRVDDEGKLWRCQHAVVGELEGPVVNLCGRAAFEPRSGAEQ